MADVRALLRQQREARRITHPFASYSDAGKLLCTLCHEVVKSEALWGNHIKGENHRTRVERRRLRDASTSDDAAGPALPAPPILALAPAEDGVSKRKHPDDEDYESGPADGVDDSIRRKRSKARTWRTN